MSKRPTKPYAPPFEPTDTDIQQCAYYIWQAEGRPTDRDLNIWLTAKELVRHHVPEPKPNRVPRRRVTA